MSTLPTGRTRHPGRMLACVRSMLGVVRACLSRGGVNDHVNVKSYRDGGRENTTWVYPDGRVRRAVAEPGGRRWGLWFDGEGRIHNPHGPTLVRVDADGSMVVDRHTVVRSVEGDGSRSVSDTVVDGPARVSSDGTVTWHSPEGAVLAPWDRSGVEPSLRLLTWVSGP